MRAASRVIGLLAGAAATVGALSVGLFLLTEPRSTRCRCGRSGAIEPASVAIERAPVAPAQRSGAERDLGEIGRFGESILVPVDGVRLRLTAVPPPMSQRTMFHVDALGPSLRDGPAVRLRLSGSAQPESRSIDRCFEANIGPGPFVECTAVIGTGWDDGRPRKLVLAIDNLVGKPISVKLRIVIMDPLE